MTEKILIVDDEKVLCTSLKIAFEKDDYIVETAQSGEKALEKLTDFNPAVILLDLRLPGINGIDVLKKIKKSHPDIAVIIMTAFGDTKLTVEAVKCGAFHFINKPFELEELKNHIKEALKGIILKREMEYLKFQQRKIYRFCDLVGHSDKMRGIYNQIEILAKTDKTTVLILGESGTGKELIASAIHFKSKRSKSPFMEINCASLPENLIESELFGYEKGAFTDAKQQKKGLLETAHKGTVFLDEIGEMPLAIQAKLLTFLEKRKFKRLGSGKDIEVDVRIIAATNQDLVKSIEKKEFRKDLYYRLNVVSINAPPLRDRKDDILLLSNHFLEQFSKDMGKKPLILDQNVEELFLSYPWYGNVRELRNVIERAVIFCKNNSVSLDLLPADMLEYKEGIPELNIERSSQEQTSIDEILLEVEKKLIDNALEEANGNKTAAAKVLDISRYSLIRRLNKFKKKRRDLK